MSRLFTPVGCRCAFDEIRAREACGELEQSCRECCFDIVRDKTDDIVERKMGKLGMKEQPLIGQDFEPNRNRSEKSAWQQQPIFLLLTEETSCTVQQSWHVTWQRQQQQIGRKWWDWGSIWKTDPGFSCGTNFRKRRANLKRSQTQIGQVAEEHAAAQKENTLLQGLISSKCGAKHKLLWLSVQRKPNCTAWWERRPKRWDSYRCTKTSVHTWMEWYWEMQAQLSPLWPDEDWANWDIWTPINCGSKRKQQRVIWTSRKWLSWNEIQSHIHKLSSQFVQNEINVNYVGARPNGVNLPRTLREMGLAGGSVDSNRHELSNETHNYERWTCMEWCGRSCHRRYCQRRDPRFRAGSET